MKLKTKFQDEDFELGEVVNANIFYGDSNRVKLVATAANGGEHTFCYNSLAHLNEDWEDAPEEPGRILNIYTDEKDMGRITIEYNTEKEAEEAVKKLEAWRRVKDTGCKPIMWRWKQDYPNDACYVEVVLKCQFDSGVHDKDLDLLFSGDEE